MTLTLALVIVGVGVLVGLMSAMLGVGGGVIMVPFIVFALDGSQHLAEGTSLLVVVPTALVGAMAHYRRGFVSLRTAAFVGGPGIAGALGGAWLAHQIDAPILQLSFGIFSILVGIQVLRSGLRGRRAPGGETEAGI